MFASALDKLEKSELFGSPFPHILIDNFINDAEFEDLKSSLSELESTEPDKIFKSNFGEKKEYRSFANFDPNLKDWAKFTSSTKFIESLQSKFRIPLNEQLEADSNYDGGGYVISPPGSFLSYHADFNFSSGIEKFRVLNVLFYLNDNYDSKLGGHLHLLDEQSKTVEKIVAPISNRLLAFLTDDTSFHGVSRNLGQFYRRSFNLYYYANSPLSKNQSSVPHKTIWISPEEHSH